MYTQASAPVQARRERRKAQLEEHYSPISEADLERAWTERWVLVAADRGARHLSSYTTFEDLCEYAGSEVLDSGRCPLCAYDLDTGQAVELHVTTPIVSAAQEQDTTVHPDLTAVR